MSKKEYNINININKDMLAHLLKNEVNMDQLTILLILYYDKRELIDHYYTPVLNLDAYTYIRDLELKGYLVREEDLSLSITGYGLNFIKKYIEYSPAIGYISLEEIEEMEKKEVAENDEFLNFCSSYISLFKKDKIGIAGKSCRIEEIIPKMKRWLKEFPKYSKEEILACTKQYIRETINSGGRQYIIEAGYFLYKRKEGTKDSEVSKLANLLEDFKLQDTNSNLGGDIVI